MKPETEPKGLKHVPVMLWAQGTFHHPRQLHDSGQFVVECSCGAQVSDPHLRSVLTEAARHTEQPLADVLQRVL